MLLPAERKAVLQAPCVVITQLVSDQVWTTSEKTVPPPSHSSSICMELLKMDLSRVDSLHPDNQCRFFVFIAHVSCCLDRQGEAKLLTHEYYSLCDSVLPYLQPF